MFLPQEARKKKGKLNPELSRRKEIILQQKSMTLKTENQQRKSVKPKAGSLKRSIKARLIKIKRKKTQITNIRNGREDITAHPSHGRFKNNEGIL